MKRYYISILGISGLLFLTSCNRSKSVTDAQLDELRTIAHDNAVFNARQWRVKNGYEGLRMKPRGDSSQTLDCPMGDGWMAVDLAGGETNQHLVLVCSTGSAISGCFKEEEFQKTEDLRVQDGPCNRTLVNLQRIER